MQKFSLITFACCLMLAFTACKKETLLETNQDLSPKKNLITNQSSALLLKEVMEAASDEQDSTALANLLLKPNKNSAQDAASACFAPIPGICGSPLIYSNSCYYKYQIWNDPNNLYVDLYFPSSVIGWKRDCNGRTCQYYITPCISLDLYNSSGAKIGSVNVASSNITVSETRITYSISALRAQYKTLACVKLSGLFYIMKKCSGCSASRVSTVCITPQQFCIQQCPSVCPTVNNVSVDKIKICGSGVVKGTVAVNGDASKTSTTWTLDGQTFSGNAVSIDFSANNTCSPLIKTISVKVVCTTDQSVLSERDFTVVVNPVLTASVSTDYVLCQAYIDTSCPSDFTNYSWNFGSQSGNGNVIPLSSNRQVLNYTVSEDGCSVSGSVNELYCEPL